MRSVEEQALLDVALASAQAIATNDVGAMASYLADDWVIVSDTGISPARTCCSWWDRAS